MNPFPAIPFVRLCIGFIIGIILNDIFPGLIALAWIVAGICLFPFIFSPHSFTAQWKNSWITGILIYASVTALGYLNTEYRLSTKPTRNIQHMNVHVAELTENPVEKTNSYKASARLLYSQYEKDIEQETTGIILYFQKDQAVKTLKHGQKILFSAPVTIPYSPQNPRQFNYKEYLANNGIFYQAYIKCDEFQILDEPLQKDIFFYIKEIRYKVLNRLHSFGLQEEITGIAAAMLTGYKEELDPDTKASFSRVGAMHILAVSGLHVGIIYLLVNYMLFFLNKSISGKLLRLLITLLFLWFYVVFTGMSPSVLRAGIMFSLISIGQTLSYKPNIYNTIFLSAFILLIANPGNLFNVGFQLSYLAVLGIVFFYPAMKNWINSSYWIIIKAWDLVCVSLAAQIATTPISLYHFGQFPTSFLITNLVVVPLAGIIIYTGIAAVIFTELQLIGSFFIWIFKFLITTMYKFILLIENIPNSYADNLTISSFQSLLLYMAIICIACFFMYRYTAWLIAGLSTIIIFLITITYRNWHINHQQQLIIYALNKESRLEIMHGREVSYPSFEELTPIEYGLFVKAYHQWKGIRKQYSLEKNKNNSPLYVQYPLIQAGSKRLWIIDDSLMLPVKKIKTDYLWIKSKRFFEPEKLSRFFKYEMILIDPSVPEKNRKKFITALDKTNIKFYDIAHSGAFIVNLN